MLGVHPAFGSLGKNERKPNQHSVEKGRNHAKIVASGHWP